MARLGTNAPMSSAYTGRRAEHVMSGAIMMVVRRSRGFAMERVAITPGNSPEKFRATFDIDGRKAIFDVTSSSVRNPLRLPDLRGFQCPNGL